MAGPAPTIVRTTGTVPPGRSIPAAGYSPAAPPSSNLLLEQFHLQIPCIVFVNSTTEERSAKLHDESFAINRFVKGLELLFNRERRSPLEEHAIVGTARTGAKKLAI